MAGFAASDDYPTAEPAKAATDTAAATRGGNIDGVIFHSDRGSRAGFSRSSRHLGLGVFDGWPATSGGSGENPASGAVGSRASAGCDRAGRQLGWPERELDLGPGGAVGQETYAAQSFM